MLRGGGGGLGTLKRIGGETRRRGVRGGMELDLLFWASGCGLTWVFIRKAGRGVSVEEIGRWCGVADGSWAVVGEVGGVSAFLESVIPLTGAFAVELGHGRITDHYRI